jgi:hypothetical protein
MGEKARPSKQSQEQAGEKDDEEETESLTASADTAGQSALTGGGAAAPGGDGLTGDGLNHLTGGAEIDDSGPAQSAEQATEQRADEEIQRAFAGTGAEPADVPRQVVSVLREGGEPLDEELRLALEDRMDADFSDVRIHTGGKAALAADAIDARAFTCGNDIIFNSGEYDPQSPEGQHLLAHELAHVRQQQGPAISMLPQKDIELEVDPDQQLEREADEAAEQALTGDEPLTVNRMGSAASIQRMPDAERLENFRSNFREEERDVPADPEVLASEVEDLKQTQDELVEKVSDDESGWMDKLGKATGKGAVGAVGGIVGAAAGSMVAPGVGTAGGAVAGQQVTSQVASSIGGSVAKTAYEPVYERGSEAIAEKSASVSDYIDEKIDEKLRERFVTSDQEVDSQGVGTSRRE